MKKSWNGPVAIKEIEFVIKNLHTKKIPGPDGFMEILSNLSKEKIISMLQRLIKKTEKEEWLPSIFY